MKLNSTQNRRLIDIQDMGWEVKVVYSGKGGYRLIRGYLAIKKSDPTQAVYKTTITELFKHFRV